MLHSPRGLLPDQMTTCYLCRRGPFADGSPVIYRLRLEQHVAVTSAIRQLVGVEMITGSAALARAMAPVGQLTTPTWCVERNVCQDCMLNSERDALARLMVEAESDATEAAL